MSEFFVSKSLFIKHFSQRETHKVQHSVKQDKTREINSTSKTQVKDKKRGKIK